LNNNEGKSKHRIRSSSRRVISQVKHACNLTQQRDWLLQGGLIASFAQIAGTEMRDEIFITKSNRGWAGRNHSARQRGLSRSRRTKENPKEIKTLLPAFETSTTKKDSFHSNFRDGSAHAIAHGRRQHGLEVAKTGKNQENQRVFSPDPDLPSEKKFYGL
jgi:hypothetical protein